MNLELLRAPTGAHEIAVLYYEARRPRDVTIVAGHGYSSSKHNLDPLCAFLAGHGFNVYSLDFPGHKLGASVGRLRSAHDLVDAMDAAVAEARARGSHTIYVLGHSMGATTAICTAGRDPSIAGVVSIATGWGVHGARCLSKAGCSICAPVTSTAYRCRNSPRNRSRCSSTPSRTWPDAPLFICAERDGMVKRSSVEELFARAPEPKEFVTVASDHTLAGENSRSAVLAWLNALHPRPPVGMSEAAAL